jgi:hypothetical protein
VNNSIYTDLVYVDSLEDNEAKAEALFKWTEMYLEDGQIFDISLDTMESLDELFYKNIKFLNEYLENLQNSMGEIKSLKKFHQH